MGRGLYTALALTDNVRQKPSRAKVQHESEKQESEKALGKVYTRLFDNVPQRFPFLYVFAKKSFEIQNSPHRWGILMIYCTSLKGNLRERYEMIVYIELLYADLLVSLLETYY